MGLERFLDPVFGKELVHANVHVPDHLFSDGKVMMPYGSFLGYQKGENGQPEIVPEEALIVQKIYRGFLEGLTPRQIARKLTQSRVPTPRGRDIWSESTILSILTNERYKGDARLQKSFCTDYLTT